MNNEQYCITLSCQKVPESYNSNSKANPTNRSKVDDDDEVKEDQSPDEEILQKIEPIYYQENVDTSWHELKVSYILLTKDVHANLINSIFNTKKSFFRN